jgi:membrane protein implicated in regulation of membrane protease activity
MLILGLCLCILELGFLVVFLCSIATRAGALGGVLS